MSNKLSTVPTLIESAATRGTDLLDERKPGWHERIVLGNLDLSDGHRCILGQVYGLFFDGVLQLFGFAYGETMTDAQYQTVAWHGFVTSLDYSELEKAWRTIIERKKGGEKS